MVVEENVKKMYDLVTSGEILTTKALYKLGIKQSKINDYLDAKVIRRVSRGIYQLENIDILYDRLYEFVEENKLHDLFILFEQIYNMDASVMNKFILYLMNDVYKLSDNLYKSAKSLDLESIRLKGSDELTRTYNNIFYNSICKNDAKAIFVANLYLIDRTKQDDIMYALLEKRQKKIKSQASKVNSLIHEKNYVEVINVLNRIKENTGLNNLETNILTLCEKYIEISNTKNIPSISNMNVYGLTEAIYCNDFDKALKICIDYNSRNFILRDSSSIQILLEDIVKLIYRINNKISYSQVLEKVKNNYDIVEITSVLDKYLNSIDKSSYFPIVLDYLKLDVLNKDNKYTSFRRITNGLEHNSYIFYVEYYVKQFYLELGRENIDKATTYLDIINNGINLGYECPIINILEEALLYTKKFYNKEEIIISNEEDKDEDVVEDTIAEAEDNSKDVEYINNLFNKLRENKEFLIVKKLNDTRKNILKGMVIESRDITYIETCRSFSIWYTPLKRERIDYKELKVKGESLYKQHKLEEAIKIFKKLIVHGHFSAYVMARLGLIYFNLERRNKCIEYLTFATELSEKFNDDFDFTIFLSKLDGRKIPEEYDDRKYKVAFYENEFTKDNNYYGITNIDEIAAMVSNGMSIDDACLSFNMTKEKINLVYLLYVKEYYMNGDYDNGDRLFKVVEKTPDKTDKVKREMCYIKQNKKFYVHRENCGNRLIKK